MRREFEIDVARNELSRNLFKITIKEAIAKGICINCKKSPEFYTKAGRAEYKISGLCERCFDSIVDTFEEE